ncbi:MAG TPA: tRNA (adenosine(37)-N6)-threonylcarbamoyltransferase complex transferase subunit TsaD [bacterium]|nr:tRNA (adenosine(37)-N6)-threonylcarbamoyltransferase complex transferase subunit TsaD [bacterium]
MLILGIETSCDETAAALVEDGRTIRSNVIASQADLHRRFGGVVPELASRKHLERLLPVIDEALDQAGCTLENVDGLAVTCGPGLIGALAVGVAAAKALALTLHRPLAGVNHLEGHIYAGLLTDPDLQFPALALVVSGAHTDLIAMVGHGRYQILGRTRDDAAGEAFDKVARAMGLGYPGGPALDLLGRQGDPGGVVLPVPMAESLEFSFSGLKTAALRVWQAGDRTNARWVADFAAGLQHVVAKALTQKTLAAAEMTRPRTVILAGGVAANTVLRAMLSRATAGRGLKLVIPPPILCTDNAAMTAAAGYWALLRGEEAPATLSAYSDLPLRGIAA